MMWPFFLSMRYFLAKRREGIISFISFASIVGMAMGVAALIIVLSVMNGFDREVKAKIVGTYAHIMVLADGGVTQPDRTIELIRTVPGVADTAEFITGQAVLRKKGTMVGVLLKGVNAEKETSVTSVISFTGGDRSGLSGNGIVLGSELMKNNGISEGDTVDIIVPRSLIDLKTSSFTVTGEFNSGRYDYDANIAIVDIKAAQDLYNMKNTVTGIAVRVADDNDVVKVQQQLRKALGYSYVVKSWMDMDRNLVLALAMEKKMMFIILAIIIIVACFNICSSLIMMVMEKTRDIGILKAIGASSAGVRMIFLTEGVIVGVVGVTIGVLAGIFAAERVNEAAGLLRKVTGYEIFPHDVYYFSRIPVEIRTQDVLTVIIFAMLFSVASGIYPAWKASRLDPVEAIRYE